MLFYYRINGSLTVGGPWFRFVVERAPTGILLKSSKAFPPSHPTTKMCLRLMLQDLKQRPCQDLVDVGCGSGILALAGLKLGVKRAVAVDLDLRAIITSRENAELNHLEQTTPACQRFHRGRGRQLRSGAGKSAYAGAPRKTS